MASQGNILAYGISKANADWLDFWKTAFVYD